MSIVTLASAKGSPGVTTTALALASWWPRDAVLVEADPAGGDVAAMTGLPEEPGLVGLAAALRRNRHDASLDGGALERYQQVVPIGAKVVTAPAGAQQAAAAVGLLAAQTSQAVQASRPTPAEGDLLIDVGRLAGQGESGTGRAARQLARAGDLVVWVCRPELAELAHLAAALGHERSDGPDFAIVLCGDGAYPAEEVAATLGHAVVGSLPADSSGAAALWAGRARSWAHSALGRATRDLAGALATRRAPESDNEDDETVEIASPQVSVEDEAARMHEQQAVSASIGSHR